MKSKNWKAADFETIVNPDQTRVWAWGVARVENVNDYVYDTSIETFVEFISLENSVTYFHNLRFDGMFIIDYLLKNGYEFVETRHNPKPKQFKALISDKNQFYSVTVGWENGKITEFRDSAKKFPNMTIARIAETFGLEESKGEIDYELYRAVGHTLTHEEQEYLQTDVTILAHALETAWETGMHGLTIAGDSLKEYKEIIGDKGFYQRFPVLSVRLDSELRRAYRGGFTYADKRFTKRVVGSGCTLDVNSLYPHVMYSYPLPYGEPEYVSGEVELTELRPLSIFSVTITAKLKKDHIPCIQIKNSGMYSPTEYIEEIVEPTTLMMSNVDFDLYNDHYDIEVLEYGGGWRFKATVGMFDEYIDKWTKIKMESTGGLREIAKLHLNSLYGKFGANPSVMSKRPVLVDNKVKLVISEPEQKEPIYVPLAVFVTAYGRDITIRAAQQHYDIFAYADTDSLHLLGDWSHLYGVDPKTVTKEMLGLDLEIDPKVRGAWAFEHAFDSAFFIRSKAYLEHLPDVEPYCADKKCKIRHDYVNAFAGLPDKISGTLGFEDIYNGAVFHGKLIPKTIPGGIVLKNVQYQLVM